MENRITSDPGIFAGKPIIRGMRLSVEMVLDLLSQGMTATQIIEEYPALEPDDIKACLQYARDLVACEETELAFIGDRS